MRGKSRWRIVVTLLLLSVICLTNSRVAEAKQMSAYTTFTFDSEGNAVESPEAYRYAREYSGKELGVGELKNPTDLYVDGKNNIYITDQGNNRIVILNPDFTIKKELVQFERPEGKEGDIKQDAFAAPTSVFVTEEGHLYVADTDNNRVVEFDNEYQFVREIKCPQTNVLDFDYVFSPTSLVVDSGNRIYLLIKNDNEGIMELTADGEFVGYYGAQPVNSTLFDWFKQLFMTDEQKSRVVRTIPRTYNSIAIDDKDFVWTTSNSLSEHQRKNYLTNKSTVDATSKRLNPSGTDVLAREGEFAPGGDLLEVSSLIDVTIKKNGIYSLLDDKANRIFTYDSGGNLLYAFGGMGSQDGCSTLATALEYFGDDLLLLDQIDNVIIRYTMTDYAKNIQKALEADEDKDFETSLGYWQDVLDANGNLELAYKAIGNSYLRLGEYKEAMEYYKNADVKEGYSKAYSYVRTDYVKENIYWMLLVVAAVGVAWYFFKRWVNKENEKLYPTKAKQTMKSQLLYAWRTIYHPFDGFYEIKTQNRGGFGSATIILLVVILSFCYKEVGSGYLFREVAVEDINLISVIGTVLIPLVLWCLANWGLTTLFEGKGKMKDVYIMSCYSLFPLIFTNIITTIMSNGLALAEGSFITFISSVGFVWMLGLMLVGSMTIHDYHFNKNVTMILASLIGMGAMLFLALLFITVGQKLMDFIVTLYEEISFRM